MDSRTYYEIHKKDSIEKKMDELMHAFYWYDCRSTGVVDAFWRRNKEDEAWYKSERQYMAERIRYLDWAIREDIKRLKEGTHE